MSTLPHVESTAGGVIAEAHHCDVRNLAKQAGIAVTKAQREGKLPVDGFAVSEYDTRGDLRPDVRKVFRSVGEGKYARLVLVCREADLNGDGSKDIVRFYNDEGRPSREEADRNFDGSFDEVTLFAQGRIQRQEIDSVDDGIVDSVIYYEGGQPVRAERDTLGRSTATEFRPDRWEYLENGRTVRIGADTNNDGKADRWERDEVLMKASLAGEGPAAN